MSQIWGKNNRKPVAQEGWESMVAGTVESIADYHPYPTYQKPRKLYWPHRQPDGMMGSIVLIIGQ